MDTPDLLEEGRIFRCHPRLELLPIEALDDVQRQDLEGLGGAPGLPENPLWGVARRADRQVCQALGVETALLLLTLREAGPLPAFVRSTGHLATMQDQLATLVLDGLLEVCRDGGFTSGPRAHGWLAGERQGGASRNALAWLSEAALRHVARLDLDDPAILSWRLYKFNQQPLTPRWQVRLPNLEAVEAFLGITPGSPLHRALKTTWHRSPPRPGWLTWSRHGLRRSDRRSKPTYKLYLSPRPADLPRTFEVLVETLPLTPAFSFKVGDGAAGILRPDKLIAYFNTVDDLLRGADALIPGLEGIAPHGVPFTAEIAGEGLLSWGLDPPLSITPQAKTAGQSWRRWVVERLAFSLLEARREAVPGCSPCEFALQRLQRERVKVEDWTPSLDLFNPIHGATL